MAQLIYFGHPVNTYNTKKESELIEIIEKNFPHLKVENPNQKHHQEGYKRFKQETGIGMNYYFQEVLPKMRAGIFLAFEDGMLGAGVYGEAEWLFNNDRRIYEITFKGDITNLILDENRKLSVEDTRDRVYK